MGEERTGLRERQDVDLEDIIHEFLRHNRFLHEYRLQKLLYLLELLSVEEDEERLTDLKFKPYMYGSYSEEFSDFLDQMIQRGEVDTRPDMHHGRVTDALIDGKEPSEDFPQEVSDRIERLQDSVKKESNEDLAQWSKSSWLYQNTDFDEEMSFAEYLEKVRSGETNSDIRENYPELLK